MNPLLILGLILSALIGLSLGLIGGGGSIITVPMLVYVLGVEAREAVGMSLAVVGGTSLIGSLLHYQRGNLNLKIGSMFGVAGVFGALAGSPLTKFLSPPALLMTFALLMFLIGILMLHRKPRGESEVLHLREQISVWKALLAGFAVGVLTGFLGVGGGFLIVPALVMFGGLSMKESVGTSLLVIFLNCAAGFIGHAGYGHFDWKLTGLVTGTAILGTIGGAMLSRRLAAAELQKSFAVFVLAVAIFLIAKNYTSLFGG